jgi:hypothetical protein
MSTSNKTKALLILLARVTLDIHELEGFRKCLAFSLILPLAMTAVAAVYDAPVTYRESYWRNTSNDYGKELGVFNVGQDDRNYPVPNRYYRGFVWFDLRALSVGHSKGAYLRWDCNITSQDTDATVFQMGPGLLKVTKADWDGRSDGNRWLSSVYSSWYLSFWKGVDFWGDTCPEVGNDIQLDLLQEDVDRITSRAGSYVGFRANILQDPAGYSDEERLTWGDDIYDIRSSIDDTWMVIFSDLHLVIQVEPDIDVSRTSCDFGDVWVGHTGDMTININNVGNENLRITGLTGLSSPFSLVGSPSTPFTIYPGNTYTLAIRFAPPSSVAYSDTLDILSNDPDEGTVDVYLSGRGIAPDIDVSPTSYDFGSVIVGQSRDTTIIIGNLGNANLAVTGLSWLTSGHFSLVSPPSTPFTIYPGNSYSLTARFSPTSQTGYQNTLVIRSNDPDEATVNVSLTGAGIKATPSPSPTPGPTPQPTPSPTASPTPRPTPSPTPTPTTPTPRPTPTPTGPTPTPYSTPSPTPIYGQAGALPLAGDVTGGEYPPKSDITQIDPSGGVCTARSTGSGLLPPGPKQYPGILFAPSSGYFPLCGDVNGDGKADIVQIRPGGEAWVALSYGTGFSNAAKWGAIGFIYDPANGFIALIGDVNGDGLADLVQITPYGHAWVSLSTGSSFAAPSNWGGGVVYLQGSNNRWWLPYLGDANGDGKCDLIQITEFGDAWVAISTGSSFAGATRWGNPGFVYCLGTKQDANYYYYWLPLALDVNGDGMCDLVQLTEYGDAWVSFSTGFSFENSRRLGPRGVICAGCKADPTVWWFAMAADMNGDRRDDLIQMTDAGQTWVALSTGQDFNIATMWGWYGFQFIDPSSSPSPVPIYYPFGVEGAIRSDAFTRVSDWSMY